MPIVHVEWATGRSQDLKKALAEELTDVMVKHTGLRQEDMIVVFEDIPKQHWFIGRQCLG